MAYKSNVIEAFDADRIKSELTSYIPITVRLQCASDITPEAIRWLWNGWLAKGKLHIFAGQAGTGKNHYCHCIGFHNNDRRQIS